MSKWFYNVLVAVIIIFVGMAIWKPEVVFPHLLPAIVVSVLFGLVTGTAWYLLDKGNG